MLSTKIELIISEFSNRVNKNNTDKPLSGTYVFIFAFSVYSTLSFLLFATWISLVSDYTIQIGVAKGGIVFSVFFIWGLVVRRSELLFRAGLPGLKARSLSIVLIFTQLSMIIPSRNSFLFVLLSLAGGILSGSIFELYSIPMEPEGGYKTEEQAKRAVDYFWRITQAGLTITIAIGISLILRFQANTKTQFNSLLLGSLVIFPFFIGVAMIIYYWGTKEYNLIKYLAES